MIPAKILIVEDDAIIASLIELRLKKLGYTILGKVTNGPDAIRTVEETNPDAILMDISLQGEMDGIEAARIIKNDFHTPIIFLTGNTDEKVLDRIISLKPVQYILKPFTDDDLRIALRLSGCHG